MLEIKKSFMYSQTCVQRPPSGVGTQKLWSFLTGGHCSEVPLCYKQGKWGQKMVVAVDKWSLFRGGR
jgi:hypothetical protein